MCHQGHWISKGMDCEIPCRLESGTKHSLIGLWKPLLINTPPKMLRPTRRSERERSKRTLSDSSGLGGEYITCRIPLDPVYHEGSLPATVYNVVKDEQYCGEIKVGLNFAPEVGGSLLLSHKIMSFSLVHTKGILFHRKEQQEISKWKKKTMVDGSSPHICNNHPTATPSSFVLVGSSIKNKECSMTM